jgi:hypothetical protein
MGDIWHLMFISTHALDEDLPLAVAAERRFSFKVMQ